MSVISMTYSNCLVYKICYLRTFNFLDIAHCQSVHPIQEKMVRVCSVWPTLSIWCKEFHIEGPSLFAIPSL